MGSTPQDIQPLANRIAKLQASQSTGGSKAESKSGQSQPGNLQKLRSRFEEKPDGPLFPNTSPSRSASSRTLDRNRIGVAGKGTGLGLGAPPPAFDKLGTRSVSDTSSLLPKSKTDAANRSVSVAQPNLVRQLSSDSVDENSENNKLAAPSSEGGETDSLKEESEEQHATVPASNSSSGADMAPETVSLDSPGSQDIPAITRLASELSLPRTPGSKSEADWSVIVEANSSGRETPADLLSVAASDRPSSPSTTQYEDQLQMYEHEDDEPTRSPHPEQDSSENKDSTDSADQKPQKSPNLEPHPDEHNTKRWSGDMVPEEESVDPDFGLKPKSPATSQRSSIAAVGSDAVSEIEDNGLAVKCSNCSRSVPIEELADHVCGSTTAEPASSVVVNEPNVEDGDNNEDTKQTQSANEELYENEQFAVKRASVSTYDPGSPLPSAAFPQPPERTSTGSRTSPIMINEPAENPKSPDEHSSKDLTSPVLHSGASSIHSKSSPTSESGSQRPPLPRGWDDVDDNNGQQESGYVTIRTSSDFRSRDI